MKNPDCLKNFEYMSHTCRSLLNQPIIFEACIHWKYTFRLGHSSPFTSPIVKDEWLLFSEIFCYCQPMKSCLEKWQAKKTCLISFSFWSLMSTTRVIMLLTFMHYLALCCLRHTGGRLSRQARGSFFSLMP